MDERIKGFIEIDRSDGFIHRSHVSYDSAGFIRKIQSERFPASAYSKEWDERIYCLDQSSLQNIRIDCDRHVSITKYEFDDKKNIKGISYDSGDPVMIRQLADNRFLFESESITREFVLDKDSFMIKEEKYHHKNGNESSFTFEYDNKMQLKLATWDFKPKDESPEKCVYTFGEKKRDPYIHMKVSPAGVEREIFFEMEEGDSMCDFSEFCIHYYFRLPFIKLKY